MQSPLFIHRQSNMHRIVYFCALIIFQVVTSDPIPPECTSLPPEVANPELCCNFPQIFKKEDFIECNVDVPFDNNRFKTGSPVCSQQTCLLKTYNLMKDENAVDKEAVHKFMDKWIEENANFKEAIEKAKEICVKSVLDTCEPTAIFICISNVLFYECPKWEDTDDCMKIKNHIEGCKAYMTKIL